MLGKSETTQYHKYVIESVDTLKFADKNIVITGGTGAIGTAIVYKLLSYGANVIICARNKEKMKKLVFELEDEYPNHIFTYEMDVTDDNQIEKVVKKIFDEHSYIDVFINNAGGQPVRVGNFVKYYHLQDFKNIELVVNTNLKSTMKVAMRY